MCKLFRVTALLIMACSMLCSCTAASNNSRAKSIQTALNPLDSPTFIGESKFLYNKKEFGVFSSDGSLLATSNGERIVVQQVKDGKELFIIEDPYKNFESLTFSPDGGMLLLTYYHKKRKLHFYQVIDVETSRVRCTSSPARGMLSLPQISSDGKLLAFSRSTAAVSTFYLKGVATNRIVAAMNFQFQKISFVAFSSNNEKVIVASSKDIVIVNAHSGKVINRWASPFGDQFTSTDFALTRDGSKLIVRHSKTGAKKHLLTAFDLTKGTHKTVQLAEQEQPFEKLVLAPDGTIFLAWSLCETIQEYSPETLQLKRTWKHQGNSSQILYVGNQKILIGKQEYLRTPDALFAFAADLIVHDRLDDANVLLQLLTDNYGTSILGQNFVSETLPCVETLILDHKEEHAIKAFTLLGRFFPEGIQHVRPSKRLMGIVDEHFKAGRYKESSRIFTSIKNIYSFAEPVTGEKNTVSGYQEFMVSLGTGKAKKRYKNLIASIESYVKKKEKAYVTLKEYSIPSPVKKPQLPAALKLVQNKFETDEAFAHRVEASKKARETSIRLILKRYREKVAVYNSAVSKLEEIKQQRLAELPDRRPAIIARALKDVLQSVRLEKPHFDRHSGVLSFEMRGNGAPYTIRIGTVVQDASVAAKLFKSPSKARWNALFAVSEEGFVLDKVTCRFATTDLTFTKTDSKTQVQSSAPASVLIASTTPEELGHAVAAQKQTAELADYHSDVTLLYSDGRTVKTTVTSELDKEISKITYAPAQSHNYLFAIGIENYKAAPNVPFAENSLKQLSSLFEKKFGIPKENQIILSSSDATGQAIQGNMRNLAARLGSHDTLFFYYAGHGLASRNGKDVYMLPSDAVRGAYEDEDFSFHNIIKDHFSKVGRAYVFLDTCFSGRANAQTMLTKGIAPVYKTSQYRLPSNVTVFFAGQGDQYANFYPQKGHRLFSYYVIRSVLDGKIKLKEMLRYLHEHVRSVSSKMGVDHLQEPFIAGIKVGTLGQ